MPREAGNARRRFTFAHATGQRGRVARILSPRWYAAARLPHHEPIKAGQHLMKQVICLAVCRVASRRSCCG